MQTLTKTPPKRTQITQAPPKPKPRGTTYDRVWLNKELRTHIEIINNTKNICSQIQLYQYLDYSKDKFEYWMRQDGANTLTQDLLKKRNELFEARLVEKGLSGGNNPAFVIFLLKNHYGYADKREVETNNQYTFNVTRGLPTPVKRKIVHNAQVKTK